MIRYSKGWYGLTLLLQVYGSALPRSLPFAIFGAVQAYALSVYYGDYLRQNWRHPFPYQAISFAVGFLVSFRYATGSSCACGRPEASVLGSHTCLQLMRLVTYNTPHV